MVIKGIALTTGDIRIDGAVRHLRGFTAGRDSPDRMRRFSALIPKDQSSARTITVANDQGGDECVTIALNFRNRTV